MDVNLVESMGGGFTIMPRNVRICKQLSDSAKLVYFAVSDYAYNGLYSYPSQETIAQETGMSVRWVQKCLQELREFGLIRVFARSNEVNIYLIVPLNMVSNLKNAEVVPVPKEKQFIKNEAEFNKIVAANERFYQLCGILRDGVRTTPKAEKSSWEGRVSNYLKKLTEGKYDSLTANDYCIAFALKYQTVYGKDYAFSWKNDTTAVKQLMNNTGLTGQELIHVMETFVEEYDRMFKSQEYPLPRLVYLKYEWIYRKLLQHIVDVAEWERRQHGETEGGEVWRI